MEIRIGTSGWNYRHWRGVFYPSKLPVHRWLSYYSQFFDTVEVNATFYGSLKRETLRRWLAETPESFVFAVKASRFITHVRRLKGVSEAIQRFWEEVLLLGNKLGPILYQLPPSLTYDPAIIEDFLACLPPEPPSVIEIRNATFHQREFLEQLKKYRVALCLSDTAGRYPSLWEEVTADLVYIRLHGSRRLYHSCYTEEELQVWARKIRRFPVKRVYVYFDNDALGWAPENALRLKALLGLPAPPLPEEARELLKGRPRE